MVDPQHADTPCHIGMASMRFLRYLAITTVGGVPADPIRPGT